MSLKSQKTYMEAIYSLICSDLSYVYGERESVPNGAKKEFLKKSAAFLRALGKDLGFTEMEVRTNPGGIAVSGEISLYGMWGKGNGVFFEITQPVTWPPGKFLYRAITHIKDTKGSKNQWLSCTLFKHAEYQWLMDDTLLELKESSGVSKNAA